MNEIFVVQFIIKLTITVYIYLILTRTDSYYCTYNVENLLDDNEDGFYFLYLSSLIVIMSKTI